MEQEECRLRLARLYKLTPDEADSLIREATDHLRRERLKQVRNQSRQISKKTLRNVKDAERKAFQEMRKGFSTYLPLDWLRKPPSDWLRVKLKAPLSNTLQNEWETNRQQRLNDAIAEYEAATKEKGAAQAAAREAEQVLMSINNQKLIQRRLDEANQRHQVALKRLRQEKLENAAVKTKARLDREKGKVIKIYDLTVRSFLQDDRNISNAIKSIGKRKNKSCNGCCIAKTRKTSKRKSSRL